MKSIFYIGAALMVSAGIYGFVDYNKATGTKEFKTLYDEKEARATHTTVEIKEQPVFAKTEAMKTVNNSPDNTVESLPPISKAEPDAAMKSSPGKQKVKKNKKLSYKLFSRAPLREDQEEVLIEELPAPKKAEVVREEKVQ